MSLVRPGARARVAALHQVARARLLRFRSVSVAERFAMFEQMGYVPWGLYEPADPAARAAQQAALRAAGELPTEDARIAAYRALQQESVARAEAGEPGTWTGMQAVARCPARFRHAAFGRRSGKTFHASREVVAVALCRPRATIWVAAPTFRLVDRCFTMIDDCIRDLGIPLRSRQIRADRYLLILENEARIEGVSLDNIWSAAGTGIHFAVIDEAAQLTEEAFTRAILPPLADRDGQCLLISSFEGDEGFFAELAARAAAEADAPPDWGFFRGASWGNFYAFPLGQDTPALRSQSTTMEPLDFLEQYGAVPRRDPFRIFPEFHPRLHLGDWPYDPAAPVDLAVDPGAGAGVYAMAVFQDYLRPPVTGACRAHPGGCLHQIAEWYVPRALTEEAVRWVQRQPWAAAVRSVVVDGAAPDEALRWQRAGYRAACLQDKPETLQRCELVRRLLRDPTSLAAWREARLRALLADYGIAWEQFQALPPGGQRPYLLLLEHAIWDAILRGDPDTLGPLQRAVRLVIDRRCVWTAREYQRYRFQRRKTPDLNPLPIPRDADNHIMDATGYYTWCYHRDQLTGTGAPPPLLGAVEADVAPVARWLGQPPPAPATLADRTGRYLTALRGTVARAPETLGALIPEV